MNASHLQPRDHAIHLVDAYELALALNFLPTRRTLALLAKPCDTPGSRGGSSRSSSARPSFRSFRFFELPTQADTGNCSVERPCFLSDQDTEAQRAGAVRALFSKSASIHMSRKYVSSKQRQYGYRYTIYSPVKLRSLYPDGTAGPQIVYWRLH